MNKNERIVCEFLRKIAPQRKWEYLGEVEHYWIGELYDELNKQLKAENEKLRELVHILYYCGLPWKNCDKCAMNGAEMHVKISDVQFCDDMYNRMRELGIETEQ